VRPIHLGFCVDGVYASAVASFDEPDDVHTLAFGIALVGIFGVAFGGFAALASAPVAVPLPCGRGVVCCGGFWALTQRRSWSI